MEDLRDLKIVIVGEEFIGKTCILDSFLGKQFDINSQSTLGYNYETKKVKVDNYMLNLNIYDVGGQERYQSLTTIYFKGSQGCFIVYDITNRESFENLEKWFKRASEFENISIILVANKTDLEEERKVSEEEGKEIAKKNNVPFFEVSAKDNKNVEDIFRVMVKNIVCKTGLLEKLKNLPEEPRSFLDCIENREEENKEKTEEKEKNNQKKLILDDDSFKDGYSNIDNFDKDNFLKRKSPTFEKSYSYKCNII